MPSNALAEKETREDFAPPKQANGDGGLTVGRILLIGAAVGLAAFAVKQLPDLRRYLRLRSM
jgi:hypothetical protein